LAPGIANPPFQARPVWFNAGAPARGRDPSLGLEIFTNRLLAGGGQAFIRANSTVDRVEPQWIIKTFATVGVTEDMIPKDCQVQ